MTEHVLCSICPQSHHAPGEQSYQHQDLDDQESIEHKDQGVEGCRIRVPGGVLQLGETRGIQDMAEWWPCLQPPSQACVDQVLFGTHPVELAAVARATGTALAPPFSQSSVSVGRRGCGETKAACEDAEAVREEKGPGLVGGIPRLSAGPMGSEGKTGLNLGKLKLSCS